ncbi:phosphoglycerate kinase [Desulfobacterota bacterium AH_259_B03_O07]|nr:phosphoglycerate kinase [Desulfobacterota bacterium AH_259_B03_O07]
MDKQVISDLSSSELKGKRVLVRADFNVPIRDGIISEDYRIRRAIPTIDFLVDKGAKVILASHLGRPKGRQMPSLSLKPIASRLSELLGKPVKFMGKVIGNDVRAAIDKLPRRNVLLLENLRYHKEEAENDTDFSKELASLADIYVNDAFGTSHRKHSSTYGTAFYFDKRLAGFLVDKELKFLKNLRDNPDHPYTVIVGGAKIKDKINALKNLLKKADKVLIGGGVAYTFLKASGVSVGQSITEHEMIDWAKKAILKHGDKISLPIDHVVAESFEKRKTCMLVDGEIPEELHGFDIGPKTVAHFTSFIKGNGLIFWNGPMGVFEVDDFSAGTTHIARAVALATWRGATTVVGGGETVSAIRKAEVLDSEIVHMSTGGGASLEFLGGEELPGISILNDKRVILHSVSN